MVRSRSVTLILLLLTAVLVVAGCASTQPTSDIISVEGSINRRGNEPFTTLMLETRDRTRYILKLADGMASDFSAARVYRVTGRVYQGEWNGTPFTFLDVIRVE